VFVIVDTHLHTVQRGHRRPLTCFFHKQLSSRSIRALLMLTNVTFRIKKKGSLFFGNNDEEKYLVVHIRFCAFTDGHGAAKPISPKSECCCCEHAQPRTGWILATGRFALSSPPRSFHFMRFSAFTISLPAPGHLNRTIGWSGAQSATDAFQAHCLRMGKCSARGATRDRPSGLRREAGRVNLPLRRQ
jgi:hypothetical protein